MSKIFLNSATETSANREGIKHVLSSVDWYWKLADYLFKEDRVDDTKLLHELEKQIVELYRALLSYQIKSVCSYYRNRGIVFFRDLFKLDDWNSDITSIKNAEDALKQNIDMYTRLQNSTNSKKLVDIVLSQEDKQFPQDLFLTNPEDDMTLIENTKGQLLHDSYVWILDEHNFVEWRDGSKTRCFGSKGTQARARQCY